MADVHYPVEPKVKAATTLAGFTAAVIALLMYGLNQWQPVAAMPDQPKAALLTIVTGVVTGIATFAAGWWARHQQRPEG